MLYLHALESMFAFCSLPELAALMCVNRSWQASVLHMRPIAAAHVQVQHPMQARLLRHVAHLVLRYNEDAWWSPSVSDAPLAQLTQQMPHLHSLDVCAECEGKVRLIFPARLRSLTLRLRDRRFPYPAIPALEEQMASAVEAVGQLAGLTDLMLDLPERCAPSLQPLKAMAQLRRLDLSKQHCSSAAESAADIAVLRQMSQLHELVLLSSLRWSDVLQPGHRLQQLRTIRIKHPNEADHSALSTLHSLTEVSLYSLHTAETQPSSPHSRTCRSCGSTADSVVSAPISMRSSC